MNQTATTEAESETPDVIAAGHAARAKIQRFEKELADREADAERARVAFEREPTPKGHTDREVAAQKAKNARSALEALREELRPALDAAERALKADRAAQLRAEADADRATFDAEIEAIKHHLDVALGDLRVMLDGLAAHVRTFNARTDAIARVDSDGERVPKTSVQRLLEQLNKALAKTHGVVRPAPGGRAAPQHHHMCRVVLLEDSNNDGCFSLEFRQPSPTDWRRHTEGSR
jgi:molecular chaperone GrpE (heat shock protein)